MDKISNPFIIFGEIPDKYFCDRHKETAWLTNLTTNGNNVVLISPRRMGKTSLIDHCYRKPEISEHYHTFYVDILPTTSLAEMVMLLGKQIYDTLLPKGKKIIDQFLKVVKSLSSVMGYDALSGMPTLTFTMGNITNPVMTLEEICHYLSNADKPCIVTIDEFQQIGRYKDKNVEALLRSHFQKMKNCTFIFSGSERHMMLQMFKDESRPFYNSADTIELNPIAEDVYCDFIMRNFKDFGKSIALEQAQYIYSTMGANTFCIQRLCNMAFSNTAKGGSCNQEVIDASLDALIEINETYFKERLSLVSAKLKPLLYAIAKNGAVEAIFSADFINSHRLISASSVQHAASQLLNDGLLTVSNGVYSLSDKLLQIYIAKNL